MCREKYILPKVEQSLGMLARVKRFRKLDAIMEMKEPKKCMRVEEFSFGQSAGKFIPQLSEKDKPLHDLLPKKNCWVWDVYQVTAF